MEFQTLFLTSCILFQFLVILVAVAEAEGQRLTKSKCAKFSSLPPSTRDKLPTTFGAFESEIKAAKSKFIAEYKSCSLLTDQTDSESAKLTYLSTIAYPGVEKSLKECIADGTLDSTCQSAANDQKKQRQDQLVNLDNSGLRGICQEVLANVSKIPRAVISDKAVDDLKKIPDTTKQLESLIENLVGTDFDRNFCRILRPDLIPPCEPVASCGYLIEIDFSPPRLIAWFGKICIYVLDAKELVSDDALYSQPQVANLREDCQDPEFLPSFQCLSVSVTLRRKLLAYLNFYLAEKDKALKPFHERLRTTLRGQTATLLKDLSGRGRHNFKTPQLGEDCSGSVDFELFWSRTVEWIRSIPDGTLPFDFLTTIPIGETKLVRYLNKTCDLSRDLVCGGGCVCVCPAGDKWRKCNGGDGRRNSNGAAAGRMFGNVGLTAAGVIILMLNGL